MKRGFVIWFLLLFIVGGCAIEIELPKEEIVSVGKLVTAEVIPTGFGRTVKMRVETEKGIYIISTITSFEKGEEIFIINGRIKGGAVIR